ncbi:MAG: hypothetical protein A3E82_01605 [Gammaproteobacteria bacterium RIFCSPHIGHO2_12_FULL_38_11]|nr:MAG: hypothetical protein A3E82_01605 [Gammaproteobacteria bacterium RIFCSPHIGHO2_12_FULL_38_11]
MYTQILPYKINSAELFEHFVHLPYSVFFDSCRSVQGEGRYDIISALPCEVIKNPLDIANAISTPFFKRGHLPNKHNLPFTIGAMGYFSYDMGRQLEKIPEIALNDIALPQAIIGIYDWSIVVDHLEQKTYFTSLHDFDHPKIKNILDRLNRANGSESASDRETQVCSKINSMPFSITKNFKSNMTREYYNNAFNEVKKNIVAGNCYQVNLAQRFTAEFTGSTWEAYKLLREKNPAPYAAFMQLDNASILSLSPERFLKVFIDSTEVQAEARAQTSDTLRQAQHTLTVETKPIKGTASRFTDPLQDKKSADDLLASEKDRAENTMIVDLLRNDISRSCIAGSVKVPKLCALESFSNVHHLVSTVTGKLSPDKTAMDLLQACFPGGSITGAPKIAAMEIIEALEPHRRSLYCGSLFYADMNGNLDSNIAIRTVICDGYKMHLYAGGGIVYDSECEKEYEETMIKIKKIMGLLSIR